MSWGSTAPAAITALAAMIRQAPAAEGVEVRDGPDVTNAAAKEVISVGYAGPDDDSAAEADILSGDLGDSQAEETVTVHCAVAVLIGDIDVKTARDRAHELLAVAGGVIAGDKTLRGTVMTARVSRWSLREDTSTGGEVSRISFDVACRAFTTR